METLEQNESRLQSGRDMIEARLRALLPEDSGLEAAMRYSLLAGGKRLRPLLTLEFCRVCGGEPADVLDAACGLEMLHTYSLIHDDLPCMDDDSLRRGRPTNHIAFGEWQALLAGDALQAEAFRAILGSQRLSDRVRAKAALILAEAAGRGGICGGQYMDLQGEGQQLHESDILEMYRRKTASLFQAACLIGCTAAGASNEQMEAARQYGAALGMAFQLRDDLLDLEGTEAELGKTAGSDARKQKSTLAAGFGKEAVQLLAEASSLDAVNILKHHFEEDPFLIWLTETLTERNH